MFCCSYSSYLSSISLSAVQVLAQRYSLFLRFNLSLTHTLMSQGQAETSADIPRIRDVFPLAFFPPGPSPLPLRYQLHLPEHLPQFFQPGRWAAFYEGFPRLCLLALCLQHALRAKPRRIETCPCANLFFILQNPRVTAEGGVGRAGAAFLLCSLF